MGSFLHSQEGWGEVVVRVGIFHNLPLQGIPCSPEPQSLSQTQHCQPPTARVPVTPGRWTVLCTHLPISLHTCCLRACAGPPVEVFTWSPFDNMAFH
jgi:hypothetical protein